MKEKSKLTWPPKHYFICQSCAKERGAVLPKDYVGTVTQGDCESCNVYQVLYPYCDFRHEKTKQEPVWD